MLHNGRLEQADKIAWRLYEIYYGRTQRYRMAEYGEPFFDPTSEDCRLLGRCRKTRVSCSCYICGNPRRQYKGSHKDELTIQERRQKLQYKDEMELIDENVHVRSLRSLAQW